MNRLSRTIVLCAALLCSPFVSARDDAPTPLTVFAAASLQETLDTLSKQWTERSGQGVRVSYAASSALARQIEQGAPAQVFVSADQEWMDWLQERGRIDVATRVDLLGNQLVLVGPPAMLPASRKPPSYWLPHALDVDGRLAVAQVDVPAGRYAGEALRHLGLWDAVSGRLAEAENVRAALAFVARGEAPLGIVYRTDALADRAVRIYATFPEDSHTPIVYPAARVRGASPGVADGFLAFLRSADAAKVFDEAGFRVLARPAPTPAPAATR